VYSPLLVAERLVAPRSSMAGGAWSRLRFSAGARALALAVAVARAVAAAPDVVAGVRAGDPAGVQRRAEAVRLRIGRRPRRAAAARG
jgi:hypothetical protein